MNNIMDKLENYLQFHGLDDADAEALAKYVWKMSSVRGVRPRDAFEILKKLMRPGLKMSEMSDLLCMQDEIDDDVHADQISKALFDMLDCGIVSGVASDRIVTRVDSTGGRMKDVDVEVSSDFRCVKMMCVAISVGVLSVSALRILAVL